MDKEKEDRNKTPIVKRFEETKHSGRLHIHYIKNTIPRILKTIDFAGGMDVVKNNKSMLGLVTISAKNSYLLNCGKAIAPGDTTPLIPDHLIPDVTDIQAGCTMYIRRRDPEMTEEGAVKGVESALPFLVELGSDAFKIAYKTNQGVRDDLLKRIIDGSRDEKDPYGGISL